MNNLVMRHAKAVARLNGALQEGDESEFELAVRALSSEYPPQVLADMHRLSDVLLSALTRFRSESRIATLAVKDVPDAKVRLDHVLKMTEDAAHQTLDIIERSIPLADATVKAAVEFSDTLESRSRDEVRFFLQSVRENAEGVRRNLTEVMAAQGFQDLTGQILRGVRTLVGEIEFVIQALASSAGVNLDLAERADESDTSPQGPAIPNIARNAVADQTDVDDLIAGLGL